MGDHDQQQRRYASVEPGGGDWARKAWLASLLLALTVAAAIMIHVPSCAVDKKSKSNPAPTAPPPAGDDDDDDDEADCDGLAVGDMRESECPAGQVGKVFEFCTEAGLKEASTCTTPAGGGGGGGGGGSERCAPPATTFAAVQPILQRTCAGCHRGYDVLEKAASSSAEYLRRFRLGVEDPQHMPKGSSLSAPEIETFERWIDDGLCPTPPSGGGGGDGSLGYQSFAASEAAMLAVATDTSIIDIEDRDTTRFLVATDIIDSGGSPELLAAYKAAAAKALNSLSPERDMAPLYDVAPGVWRFDREDVGIDEREWRAIEDADLVNIQSKTSRGQLLQLLTKTRKPWLHVASLIDAATRNSTLYYDLLEIPRRFADFTQQIGVDYSEDLRRRRDVLFSAFNTSPLSINNRMVTVHTGTRDGSLWCSYDTGPQDAAEKNFSNFPLLADIGGERNAQFVAGECIFTLANGLQGFTLWLAKQTFRSQPRVGRDGQPVHDENGHPIVDRVFVRSDLDTRADVGAVQVVRDFLSPVSAEIRSGISCFRCHAPGILPIRDEIRPNTIDNGAQFGTDRDLILDVYRDQTQMDAAVAEENARFAAATAKLGIGQVTANSEPVTITSDSHLLPWNLKKVCGTLWLSDTDCQLLVDQSLTAQTQWGQLSTGGSIAFEQFTASVQQVIAELRLFEDPL